MFTVSEAVERCTKAAYRSIEEADFVAFTGGDPTTDPGVNALMDLAGMFALTSDSTLTDDEAQARYQKALEIEEKTYRFLDSRQYVS